MPMFKYKCSECETIIETIVGSTNGASEPTDCKSCDAKNTMQKQFSMDGISGDVVGGFDYQYGKKAWKKGKTMQQKAAVLSGDANPY